MLIFHQFEGSGPGAVIRLHLETPTAWMSKDGKYYSLGSLWYLVSNRHMGASEYIRKVHAIQHSTPIHTIDLVQIKEVKEYFTRYKAETKMIDKNKRTATLLNKNELRKSGMRASSHNNQLGDQKQGSYNAMNQVQGGSNGQYGKLHQKKRDLKLNEKL